MGKISFVRKVVAAGGWLLLCAAPAFAVGQSNPGPSGPGQSNAPGTMPPAPTNPGVPPFGKSAAPPDLLEGLTLSDDQKAKIDQIRADTKSRSADVANDQKLDPDTANAMRRGFQRLENGRILEVLTLEQQQQVRKRIAAWRATQGKPQYPMRPASAPEQASRAP